MSDKNYNDENDVLYIEHGHQYTGLLKSYIENVNQSNKLKVTFKKVFL